ncbi:hypothetical protein [Streptomyces triticisoli]|jgi:hypothetical protein|uniref:hypothetical protein n=1 Tax=Streptomyces triticisoli TaxID=2182797 RepID=UPI0018E52557|nr:hypothetical protein [Streptomyces triticisoli]
MNYHLVEDASDDSYVMHILDITLTPTLPRLGHPLRWEMHSHLKETVDLTRVTCRVIMKVGPMKILDKNYRLPDLLAAMGTSLSGDPRPPAGPWKQTWHLQIPPTVPVARHRIHLRARTGDGKNFLALNIPVAFTHRWITTSDHTGAPNRPGFDRDLSWSL